MKTLLLSFAMLFALVGCAASTNGQAAFDQPQQDYNSIYKGW